MGDKLTKLTIGSVARNVQNLEAGTGVDITGNVISVDTSDLYTKTEVDALLDDYYTADEVDTELADYYTKTEVDTELGSYYTKTEVDTELADYYKKTESYSKTEVDTKLGDYYKKTETYGKTEVYTKTEADTLLANKVDKVTGKGLSTNDYTATDKAIVDGVTASLNNKVDKVTGKSLSTNDYTNADKAIVDAVTTNLAGKVDKVAGKGLSTNDYTTAEKTKLAGIEAGAEVNVQSDWNQTDNTKDDFIKNKPGKATQSADGLMSKEDKAKLDGINITKEGILELLGYVEIEIAIEDTDGEVTMRKVLAEEPPETFRTVLYSDGFFVINESSNDKAANQTAHGSPTNIYPAYDPVTNPYDFSASGSQPWYEQRRNIFTIEIGAPLKPTSVARWFGDLYFLTAIDLTNLDTSDCTNFSRMFSSANRLPSVDVSGLDVSKATTMQMMFNANNVMSAIDISAWNTPALTNTNQMFNGCGSLVTIKASANFNVSGVTNSGNMFNGCSSLVGGQGTVYDSSVVDKTRAKIDGGSSDPGYFTAP